MITEEKLAITQNALEKLFENYLNGIGIDNTNARIVRQALLDVTGQDPLLNHVQTKA